MVKTPTRPKCKADSRPFEKSVFVNCPFDKLYEPILQSMLFCIIYLGFYPRIASERNDSAEQRLTKIINLIKSCRYSIHDLSRCQAEAKEELYRLNMPFELGMDYGCREYRGGKCHDKKFLILEEKPFRFKATISDLSGCDIAVHRGKFEEAVRKVRNWLVSEAGAPKIAPNRILSSYYDFQRWYWDDRRRAGYSEDDIRDYPTLELLDAMADWIAGRRSIEG